MKCCKKIYPVIIFGTFMALVMYLVSAIVCYADNQVNTYYVIFGNSEENGLYIELGQQQILFTNASDLIDLKNLEFSTQITRMHYQFSAETSDLDVLTAKVREYLLYYGYAKLINLDIATDSEKKNQQHAQEMKLGIWESPAEDPDPDEGHTNNTEDSDTLEKPNLIAETWQAFCFWVAEKWQVFCSWAIENRELIITSVLGCGLLAFLGREAIKYLRTRKKIIFFGGANSAGKTTMSQYLMNPDASKEDLLNKEPSLHLLKERIIRDDTNRKLTLKAVLVDSPGHELEHIIDELSLTLRNRIFRKKYVVIIIVAPTKSNESHNEIDRDYIDDQLITISKLWYAVFKAKRTVKPQNVILFINKLDLYDDRKGMISEFSEHTKQLKKICNESNIDFSMISGSILNKTGMTELMKILKK